MAHDGFHAKFCNSRSSFLQFPVNESVWSPHNDNQHWPIEHAKHSMPTWNAWIYYILIIYSRMLQTNEHLITVYRAFFSSTLRWSGNGPPTINNGNKRRSKSLNFDANMSQTVGTHLGIWHFSIIIWTWLCVGCFVALIWFVLLPWLPISGMLVSRAVAPIQDNFGFVCTRSLLFIICNFARY